jgi:hypothetical protein
MPDENPETPRRLLTLEQPLNPDVEFFRYSDLVEPFEPWREPLKVGHRHHANCTGMR